MLLLKRFRQVGFCLAVASGLTLASCQSTSPTPEKDRKADPADTIRGKHEVEISEILNLARAGEWEEADLQASALYAMDPLDPRVARIRDWVSVEMARRREKELEDQLALIAAQDSRFNPTLGSTLLENRKRGLPMRSDVREATQNLANQPLVPESYGKVIRRAGPMYGLDNVRGPMAELLDQRITLQVDNVTLESIIFDLGPAQRVNFVADRSIPAFQDTLSVNMENVRLAEFFRYVARNMDVSFQIGDDLIWILDGKKPEANIQETRFYRLRKGFVMPAEFGASEITQVTRRQDNVVTQTDTQKVEQFVRDGAPHQPSVGQAIKQFFAGEFMIDYERNLIVARGTYEQLAIIERIIEEFDQPIQQVLIEARFVTVTRAAFLQLGVNWETGRDSITDRRAATDFTGFGTNVGLGLEETFTRVFGRRNLSATLTALEQSGESQTLSSPRITVINNRPATISDGKLQYYYEEYTVSQTILERRSKSQLVPKGKPTELTSGVSLDVLASIGGDGSSIMLALNPKVSQDVELVTFATVTDRDDEGNVVSTFDIRLPESRNQELSTRVIVQSGQTVVMGGVVQRDQSTFTESVPILGSIPIIGAAFRKRTEFDQPRYLLIFVTATLLSESGEFVETVGFE
jgi:type IV pilus assembly protein PilQ